MTRTTGGVTHEATGGRDARDEEGETVPQDPAVIQQQIENTRAELAETIDSIAEIVSPKRVIDRAKVSARERFDHLKDRVREVGGASDAKALEAGPGAPGGPVLAADGTTQIRAVRWDRVGAAGGLVVLLVVLTAWRRHGAA